MSSLTSLLIGATFLIFGVAGCQNSTSSSPPSTSPSPSAVKSNNDDLIEKEDRLAKPSRSEKSSRSTWKLRGSRLVANPAAKATPQMSPKQHTHTLTLVFEPLPGEKAVTDRSWSVGVNESGLKLAGAILEDKGKKQLLDFEQLGIERKAPFMEYWMNLVLPPNLSKKAVLKMNIHADEEPDREVVVPLVATKVP